MAFRLNLAHDKSKQIILALRYTTNDGQWKESAVRLTNTLVNIRAIINHFAPKVDQWAAANHLSSLTEEQVSKNVLKLTTHYFHSE